MKMRQNWRKAVSKQNDDTTLSNTQPRNSISMKTYFPCVNHLGMRLTFRMVIYRHVPRLTVISANSWYAFPKFLLELFSLGKSHTSPDKKTCWFKFYTWCVYFAQCYGEFMSFSIYLSRFFNRPKFLMYLMFTKWTGWVGNILKESSY